jgi:hypothetical protein
VPTTLEVLGLLIVMTGLILAVTQAKTRVNANTNASSPPRFPIQSKA